MLLEYFLTVENTYKDIFKNYIRLFVINIIFDNHLRFIEAFINVIIF